MHENTDVLIFVEDPGAANYLFQIPAMLAERGLKNRFLANGLACRFLKEHDIQFDTLDQETSAEQVFDRYGPRLVIVGTSTNIDTFGFDLISCARMNKIQSIGVVDTLGNAEYRFRGRENNPLAHAPNWLIVPDEWTRHAFVELGYPGQSINVYGHPQYDHLLRLASAFGKKDRNAVRDRIFNGIQKDRKVIVFASVLSTGFNPHQFLRSPDFTMTGRGESKTQTEIVLEEFLDTVRWIDPLPYLVLRLHPKQRPEDFSGYLDEFDLVSSGGTSFDLIFASDLVVGLPTMLLVEATFLGKPTLAIVSQPIGMTSLPTVRMGFTPCVNTREQLHSILPGLLLKNMEDMHFSLKQCFIFGAGERIAGFVESLLDD